MRVLHINCNYVGTTLHQLMIEQLDALGYSNQVFVPTYDKNLSVIEPNENVCLTECFRKWDRLCFDYKQKKIRKGLEAKINVADYDLIHAYTLFTDGNCARNLYKKYGIPYIVAIRNTDVNDFFRLRPLLRGRGVRIMLDAMAVFFLSESYRKQVFEIIPKKHWAEIEKKTHIIPNGIDDFWLKNIPSKDKTLDKEKIKLVYAGRIDRNKNIPTIQKAMAVLRKQGYETVLSVVGKVQD
ncbi:MAG: glycosyltransferase family 4 protein, partial [Firmicutes bacterium]|nr:glycosyltransferase family 4 protein [Bacillota bacterium]